MIVYNRTNKIFSSALLDEDSNLPVGYSAINIHPGTGIDSLVYPKTALAFQKWLLDDLYLKAFCRLVVPFPRLDAMRARPDFVTDWAEYQELVKKEAIYYKEKIEAERDYFLLRASIEEQENSEVIYSEL